MLFNFFKRREKPPIAEEIWLDKHILRKPENPFSSDKVYRVKVLETRLNYKNELWVKYVEESWLGEGSWISGRVSTLEEFLKCHVRETEGPHRHV